MTSIIGNLVATRASAKHAQVCLRFFNRGLYSTPAKPQSLRVQVKQKVEEPREYDVGFIGSGKMAQALAFGLMQKNSIITSDVSKENLKLVQKKGLDTCGDNQMLTENSDVVVISVKPNMVNTVLEEISPVASIEQLFVSIAAGVKIEQLEKLLPEGSRVVRVMPNTPSLVGSGATVYAAGQHATDVDCKTVEKLFLSVGTCDKVPEGQLDAVTGLSGSGPAYVFLALEAMSDGGVKQGLPRDLATKLAAQTMMGAAKMVLETGLHPGQLKDSVTSPGGTTIHGVSALEDNGFRNCLIQAIQAATNRSKELGKE